MSWMSASATREALRISTSALLSHKLRSLLTMLGVIFGVAAVISMLSIGEGARREALRNIQQLGARNILVDQLPAEEIPDEDRELGSPGLGLRDMRAIRGMLPGARLSPVLRSDAVLQAGRVVAHAEIQGVQEDFAELFPGLLVEGRWLSAADNRGRSRVCVLGSEISRELFGWSDPRGRLLKIDGQWYTVVGRVVPRDFSDKGRKELELRDLNRDVYIPFETLRGRHLEEGHPNRIDRLVIQVQEVAAVAGAEERLRLVLERRHQGARDTRVTVPWELIRQSQATQRMFNLVMGAIASISLIVGGIGIMNIMLSSVLERTREIGIRRSVGATAAHVMQQFIIEAVLLSVGGGLAGVALGLALSMSIDLLADWQTHVTLWSVALSFLVSAGTGLVFGIYPARRAAALDPIEALRHE